MKERKWIYICQARLPLSPGPAKASAWLVAKALVAAGAHVVAGSRTPGKQLPLLEESGQVSFVAVDLTQPGAAEELIAAATYRGGIDILINNVGGATVRPGGLASISDDQWRASWDLNVMGVVRPTRAVLPEIERRGGGSIVIVSSICAYDPGPNT
jgi:NAD(P)-dependent dehydrogenase (short-subunit alcohol dehydrogenase family)